MPLPVAVCKDMIHTILGQKLLTKHNRHPLLDTTYVRPTNNDSQVRSMMTGPDDFIHGAFKLTI